MPQLGPQRVLFVDDETSILAGLKRMLHPLRHEIQSRFASSGAEALECLAGEPFDIVVADMRMPVMDGAALLAEVKRRHPHIIRLALSGHADVDTAMRAVPVTHQFLAKPCDGKTLRDTIMRVAELRSLLEERELQAVAGCLSDIPARPENYSALSVRLADPNTRSSDIAGLISRDVGATANLLRIVNSAFFGLPRRVTSIESAINYLGTTMLRSIVLAHAAISALGPRARKFGYDLQGNETHALLSAQLAMQFFSEKHAREDAFTAGLLQNLGELLLVASAPDNALSAFHHAKAKAIPLDDAERELGVVSHAQLGAYLLGAWGLPFGIVEVVAHHHQPDVIPHETLEIVDAVYIANLVAQHMLDQRVDALQRASERLARFGAMDMLDKCQATAHRCLKQEGSTS